jgi:FkbM family methyltransferase
MQFVKEAGLYFPDSERHFTAPKKGTAVPACVGYQLDRLEAAYRHVTDWTVAVDAGAHVGIMTRELARRFKHVFAFEPHPETFACLEKNVAGLANVSCCNAALGRADGFAGLEMEPKENTGDRQVIEGGEGIHVCALDGVPLVDCNLIKMDVQGYEAEVLEGARDTIAAFSPVVIAEVEPRDKLRRHYGKEGAVDKFMRRFEATEVARVGHDRVYAFGPDGALPYVKYRERGAYHWADYESGKNRDFVDELVAYVAARGNELVVDFGCGDGLLVGKLGEAGVNAMGVDNNLTAIDLAKARGLHVYHKNVYRAYAARTFVPAKTAVCLVDVLEHLHRPELALHVAGQIADTVYLVNPDPAGSRWHHREFPQDELRDYVTRRGWRVAHERRMEITAKSRKTLFHLEKAR